MANESLTEKGERMDTPIYTIRQGDQYLIPVVIQQGTKQITPDDCAGVRIGLDNVTAYYPGTLTYGDGAWYFPLTQEQSNAMASGTVQFQVQVKFEGGDVVSSPTTNVEISESILKGEW